MAGRVRAEKYDQLHNKSENNFLRTKRMDDSFALRKQQREKLQSLKRVCSYSTSIGGDDSFDSQALLPHY